MCRFRVDEDTLLDYVVLRSGQFLHHNVDEAGDESRQEADEPTDKPAADLQTPEALNTHRG